MKKLFCALILGASSLACALDLTTYNTLGGESAPYCISLISPSKQMLEYIGTCHTSNSWHPQYSTIKKRWKKFLEHADPKKITLVEAIFPGYYASEQQALRAGCDTGFAAWLSESHAVPVIGAELGHAAVVQQVIQRFGKDKGYYFAFAQALSFYARTSTSNTYEQFVLSKVHEWTGDSSVTFEYLKKLHESFTGSAFSYNRKYFIHLMDLSYHNSFIEKTLSFFAVPSAVAQKFYPLLQYSHYVRDAHTLSIIKSQWSEGKNIFIVYGALHAAALKRDLTAMVTGR